MVSHNGKDVLPWADKIFIMQEGNFVQEGTAQEIYHSPVNEYCAGLFGDYNLLSSSKLSLLISSPKSGTEVQQAIVRPEGFAVSNSSSNAILATVEKCLFNGSHYLLHVRHDATRFLVYSEKFYELGSSLYLKLKKGAARFINA